MQEEIEEEVKEIESELDQLLRARDTRSLHTHNREAPTVSQSNDPMRGRRALSE